MVNDQDAKKDSAGQASLTNPTAYSYVYLRIQPFFTTIQPSAPGSPSAAPTHLQFLLHLADPGHDLVHRTLTQTMARSWLASWDQHDWIEDMVVEVLRVGVETIGQDYLAARMRWLEEGDAGKPVMVAEGADGDEKQGVKAE